MSLAKRFSYQRLRNENEDDNDHDQELQRATDHINSRIRSFARLKRLRVRKRLKMKMPRLKKFMTQKTRVVMVSIAKIVKRLKESQSHFGDLFAGNYMFMQVNPSSMKPNSLNYQYAIHGAIKRIKDDLRHNSPSTVY